MLKVVKVRLYPDIQQQQSLAQAFGSCRDAKPLSS
ncbi:MULTISPECIES: helix-turn-helix domain-containing protein [Aphanizomenonaceae]|uniref:Helix-turn-helix domain-containing protein n=1 Tax=Dolichospermum heterosporum TAC447 TaxID=747523 RepID=A0ABY5LV11_9CYAN|nr:MULTISPECIES: helix-turn-helix domain-containing protein [Aphanizomenonaceae]MBE9257257.1 helix-turn-helix domain-containing protein [Dolichospermum sp. LEGE 00246]MDK2412232.1 helix-turn-helix domain-containing protein [Aphanizomenon sp. 202]MDK2461219.1 helix-turn-helix domain-containing protein [Aphanizomenon sp. PH219]UUO14416.1 helix-turn-helix domain-containing protein [Dolichospermum heterosporum TAC447]